MGFRLNIETEDKELFGDDHKLYGYWRYDEVKDSFMVLYPLIQEQWPKLMDDNSPEDKLYGYWRYDEVKDSFMVLYPLIQEQWPKLMDDNSPEEVYHHYFYYGWATDRLTVSNEVFEVFARKYIMDLVRTSHTPELVAIIALYLARLCYMYPGDKILYWN